ncbi:hypothetical protein P9597_23715 [Aneurinibacillus migulanus]|uniref:hypothetical protein n=1 Tax=Aneurinibacillus migulanus TaxID=47500 RepID=UPI002E1C8F8B|nr:hypothetical protein [Aneurinibacillus migulanus]
MPQTGVGSSPHGSVAGRFLPHPGEIAKHLGRREEGDSCGPFSPGWGNRSGRETKSLVCVQLWWYFPLKTINTLGIHRWIEKNDAYGVRPLCFSSVERVVPRTKSTGNCLLP